MVRSCCAHNCTARDVKSTREAGVQFYRFPQNEAKRTLWVNAVNRKSFRQNASTVICSQHFVGGRRSDDPLSPAYVPSIFSFTTPRRKRELEQGVGRFQAAKRRRENKETYDSLPEVITEEHHQEESLVYPPNTVSVGIQTDLTADHLIALENDYQQRVKELSEVREAKGYPDKENLKNNDKLLRFYTGLSSFTVLMAVFNLVSVAIPESPTSKLSKFQAFVLTLMKLRLDVSNYDLGFRFGISASTVSRVFSKWIEAMDICLSFLITWPDRENLRKSMPFCFRPNYGLKVTSIIDCFKLFIEKPSNLLAKSCTWSQYKHFNTAKYLIAITPQGIVSFVSNGWGGRVSDKYIVENSGYLLYLLPGDVVLADRGFNVEDSVALQGATLDIPAFTRGCDQLPPGDIEATRKLANVRIHVERIIGAVRQRYQILSATGVLQELVCRKSNGTTVLDSIVKICCALNNVCTGIVPFN